MGQSREISAEDVWAFKLVADLELSPDGNFIACVVQEVDGDEDRYFSNLWLVPTSGEPPRQLTFGRRHSYASPRFSPDGTELALLSDRDGGASQLYILSLDGGEPRRVTSLADGAGEPKWSPDGSRIAFAAGVRLGGGPDAPRIVTRLPYKSDGKGYLLDRPTQLFVIDRRGGAPRQLTRGDVSASDPAWSPEGRRIAFCRMREAVRESHRSDVCIVDLEDGSTRQLTSRCAHTLSPSWSPDARTIAFYGSDVEGDARRQVWTISEDGRDEQRLTSEDEEIATFPLGRTAPPVWSRDGREVAVISATAARSGVALVGFPSGEQRNVIAGDRQITMLSANPQAVMAAYLWSDTRLCGNVSVARWDGSDRRDLLNVNESWAAERRWPRATLRHFESKAGPRNHGLLFFPEGDGPWPLLVDVHGGPQAYVEMGFPYHPYWYALVARGWAVLSLNPVGSASYGKEFVDRLNGRWGLGDLPEHLAAVEGLVSEGLVDGARVAIAGKSYGGYMAAWAVGHSKRFRAAVCSAAVTNLESHFGTSDTGYYIDPHDMAAEPFDDRDRYHELSPIRCAHTAEAPTLILHGEEDQRCPIGQAEELFAALMRAGRTQVQFVRYPGGSHSLAETGRPSHRVDYNRRIVEWLEQHCRA